MKQYGQLSLIECYANQLNQVLLNILNNAIDALSISPAPLNPEIRINTQIVNEKAVRISLADNGLGMSDNIRQKMFNPLFYNETRESGNWTGIIDELPNHHSATSRAIVVHFPPRRRHRVYHRDTHKLR